MIASKRHTFILLSIFAVLAIGGYLSNARGGSAAAPNRLSLYVSVIGAQLLLVHYVRIGIRKRGVVTLRELIGRFRWYDLPIAAAFVVVMHYASLAMHALLRLHDDHTSALKPRSAAELALWIVVSCVAGFSEELTFRGYFQRQLPVGVVTQAIVFGLSHGYQGMKSVVNIAAIGLLFGLLALVRRSLVPGMLAHAANDIMAVLRMP